MVVVAHPGDEAFGFGGAIAGAAAEGAYVVVVCATRGWYDEPWERGSRFESILLVSSIAIVTRKG